jgi:hypothetical protein
VSDTLRPFAEAGGRAPAACAAALEPFGGSRRAGRRGALVAFDRSTLISDRARLLEDKSRCGAVLGTLRAPRAPRADASRPRIRLFSDRSKIVTERAAEQRGVVPDVPRAERGAVATDRVSAPPSPTPRPSPRTIWTRRVPHPVLTGHAASLTPY